MPVVREWSDSGKIVKAQSAVFDDPFNTAVMQRPFARAGMQALSHAARETAVAKAVNDVKRLAMPWFTKKLETAGRL